MGCGSLIVDDGMHVYLAAHPEPYGTGVYVRRWDAETSQMIVHKIEKEPKSGSSAEDQDEI